MASLNTSLLTFFTFCFAVALARPESTSNEEYGTQFEGDMVLSKAQNAALRGIAPRLGLRDKNYRWPNKTVIYELKSGHSKEQKDYIKYAMQNIEAVTCIKFKPRTTERGFISIESGNGGCYSNIGYQGDKQVLNLSPNALSRGCFRLGVIVHEMLHAIGFVHMHSAYDRDDYIDIDMNNIMAKYADNFDKFDHSLITHYKTKYDYDSIMHYDAFSFSKNEKPTIIPRDKSFIRKIGQREGFSPSDVQNLNDMYAC